MTNPNKISSLELAAPFLFTIVILLVSVVAIHEIAVRLEQHFERNWAPKELKRISPDRAPGTYALAVIWAIDTAQIATIVGTPLSTLVILRHVYKATFIIPYTAILGLGILVFSFNLRQVEITKYRARGFEVFGYRLTPVTIAAIALNVAGATVAAYIVR